MRNFTHCKRSKIGISLLEVMIGMSIIAVSILFAYVGFNTNKFFGATQYNESTVVAQQDLQNLQTRLQSIVQYDTSIASSDPFHQGQAYTITPYSPNGTTQSTLKTDTGVMTATITNVSREDKYITLSLNYSISGTGTSGATHIYLHQKATDGCQSSLNGIQGSNC